MDSRKRLRTYLNEKKCIIAPGAFDVLSAKAVAAVGFPAVYITGYGTAASYLGLPDYGIMGMADILDTSRRIVNAVNIPVIADADTGYGNPINVYRTVREYEAAGLAAIQLEDQVFPKRCGHMQGKQVIPAEDFSQKIKAAVEARQDPDFVIIARTDARAPLGMEEAVERANAYADAGADVIFFEAPQSREELEYISKKVHAPLLANMVETGKTPLIPAADLEKMGFSIIIYPVATLFAATKTMMAVLEHLKATGNTEGMTDHMVTFKEFTDFIGLPFYHELEKKFG